MFYSKPGGHIPVDQDKTDDQDVSGFGSDDDLPLSMNDTPRGRPETPRGGASGNGEPASSKGKSPRSGVTQVQPMGSKQGLNKSMDSELG